MNEPAAVTLRPDPRQVTADALADELRSAGIEVTAGALVPDALVVRGIGDPARLPAVREGRATPQDQGSQAVVAVLAPAAGGAGRRRRRRARGQGDRDRRAGRGERCGGRARRRRRPCAHDRRGPPPHRPAAPVPTRGRRAPAAAAGGLLRSGAARRALQRHRRAAPPPRRPLAAGTGRRSPSSPRSSATCSPPRRRWCARVARSSTRCARSPGRRPSASTTGRAPHCPASRPDLARARRGSRTAGVRCSCRRRPAPTACSSSRCSAPTEPRADSVAVMKLAPSILSADFAELAAEVERVREVADLLHVDVMDGHFVPNLTIGPPVVASLRARTDLFLDCHLMVDNPGVLLDEFADAGADRCIVHVELGDPRPLFDELRAARRRRGPGAEPADPGRHRAAVPRPDRPAAGDERAIPVGAGRRSSPRCSRRCAVARTEIDAHALAGGDRDRRRHQRRHRAPRPRPRAATSSSPAARCSGRPIRWRRGVRSSPRPRGASCVSGER